MTAVSFQRDRAAVELAEQLIALAEKAASDTDRRSSLMMYGIVLDCAYRIKAAIAWEESSLKNWPTDKERREVDRRQGDRRRVNPHINPSVC